jgi:hypothetical protein
MVNNRAVLAHKRVVLNKIRESQMFTKKEENYFKPFLVQPFLSLHCQWLGFIIFKHLF